MSNEILQAIAEIYKNDNPEDAEFYTLDWVRAKCAGLQMSPEELLADLQKSHAIAAASADIVGDQPWTKDLPPHYVEKFSGPIDAASFELMDKGDKH